MRGFLLAVQFLTVIPVRIKGTVTERQIGCSGIYFPLVGVIQGALLSLMFFLLVKFLPGELVSGLIILVLIATNRGFHLDALADSFDAVAVKSSGNEAADRRKRLLIMKDSTTGAMGVTAIVMSILLKYLSMISLLRQHDGEVMMYLLFLMPVFSRWAMIPVMGHGRPAREDGLGKIFIERTGPRVTILSSLLLALVYFAITMSLKILTLASAVEFFFLAGLSLYVVSLLWAVFCARRFGGLTGDTVGAVAEVSDLLFLVVALLFF
jgi:adenosylcobinamide-GDP ribazoletransferase